MLFSVVVMLVIVMTVVAIDVVLLIVAMLVVILMYLLCVLFVHLNFQNSCQFESVMVQGKIFVYFKCSPFIKEQSI